MDVHGRICLRGASCRATTSGATSPPTTSSCGSPAPRSCAPAEMSPRLENLRQRYGAGVRHTDEELAGWIADLEARGRWDEAAGLDPLGPRRGLRRARLRGSRLLLRRRPRDAVPLWLKLPRSWGLPPKEIGETLSTYDVLPTTLALLGLPPVSPAFGADLSALLRGEPGPPERTVIVETDDGPGAASTRRCAVAGSSTSTSTPKAARSCGRSSISRTIPARRPTSARSTRTWRRPSPGRSARGGRRRRRSPSSAARRPSDPQTRERLRALGYVDE